MLRFIYYYWNVYAHDPHLRRATFASQTLSWTMCRLPWPSIRHWSSSDVVHRRLPNRRCVNWASARVAMCAPIRRHHVHTHHRCMQPRTTNVHWNRFRQWSHCVIRIFRCVAKIAATISVDRPLTWDWHGIESNAIAVRRTDSMAVWSVGERTVVCCRATAVWRQWEHIARHRIDCCRLASINASWNRALKTVDGCCNRHVTIKFAGRDGFKILIGACVCFRLQATAVADPGRVPSNPSTAMELGTTPPQQQHMIVPPPPVPPPFRVLTNSNSFDSKSNIPNFSGRFYMSAEATKLFNTLQQSPLPINSEVSAISACRPHRQSKLKFSPSHRTAARVRTIAIHKQWTSHIADPIRSERNAKRTRTTATDANQRQTTKFRVSV